MLVFVTGATSGIGRALVRHYVGKGALVGATGRRAEALSTLAAECGDRVETFPVDVRDAAGMHAAATRFMSRFGVPSIVIANAGVSFGTLTAVAEDIDTFQEIVDINLLGMVKTFHPFIEPMRRAGRGTLVGISSVAGVRGLPGASAYSASKAAANAYLESLRVELHGSGVRVITLAPGYIDTPMTAHNPYPMPFLLTADVAARRFARAIARGRRAAVIPWPMAIVARVLRWMPDVLYERAFARAPRKPRKPA